MQERGTGLRHPNGSGTYISSNGASAKGGHDGTRRGGEGRRCETPPCSAPFMCGHARTDHHRVPSRIRTVSRRLSTWVRAHTRSLATRCRRLPGGRGAPTSPSPPSSDDSTRKRPPARSTPAASLGWCSLRAGRTVLDLDARPLAHGVRTRVRDVQINGTRALPATVRKPPGPAACVSCGGAREWDVGRAGRGRPPFPPSRGSMFEYILLDPDLALVPLASARSAPVVGGQDGLTL
ncbi:hypothetical protein VTO73DRAFT_2317 [Trametes versicolor]